VCNGWDRGHPVLSVEYNPEQKSLLRKAWGRQKGKGKGRREREEGKGEPKEWMSMDQE